MTLYGSAIVHQNGIALYEKNKIGCSPFLYLPVSEGQVLNTHLQVTTYTLFWCELVISLVKLYEYTTWAC